MIHLALNVLAFLFLSAVAIIALLFLGLAIIAIVGLVKVRRERTKELAKSQLDKSHKEIAA